MSAHKKEPHEQRSINKIGVYLNHEEYTEAYRKAKLSGIKNSKGDINMSAFLREVIKQYKV